MGDSRYLIKSWSLFFTGAIGELLGTCDCLGLSFFSASGFTLGLIVTLYFLCLRPLMISPPALLDFSFLAPSYFFYFYINEMI
jgi:hypothetical protein